MTYRVWNVSAEWVNPDPKLGKRADDTVVARDRAEVDARYTSMPGLRVMAVTDLGPARDLRLWQVPHDYYCSEENYFKNGCSAQYNSWESFKIDTKDEDMDLNLVFHWDWDKTEKTLSLFYIGQRKGLFRSVQIRAMHPDEEPAVRAWLQRRWEHLLKLWLPFVAEVGSAPTPMAEQETP